MKMTHFEPKITKKLGGAQHPAKLLLLHTLTAPLAPGTSHLWHSPPSQNPKYATVSQHPPCLCWKFETGKCGTRKFGNSKRMERHVWH